ncbi:MAG TPA: ABC transporter permease [Candidatus Saccharimonadales bacterium]|nr:ABC transporter permease [Candidatus Saccharimonadales bacterium]
MIDSLKSEFRKLLTVRSTYIITILVLAFISFIAFYVEGWRLNVRDLADPHQLTNDVFGALGLSVFGAIIAILLMTHEYRYNTVMYTLTNSSSRTRVLLSKAIVISAYAVFLTVIISVLSPLASYLGIHAHGHTLAPQTFNVGDVAWRSLFYGWSYGVAGLLLAVLIRSQVGAIAALFVLPGAIEPLLGQLFKHNAVYLPFTAQGQIIGQGAMASPPLDPGKAAVVFCIYLVVGWVIAWVLFLRRDAN